MMKQIQQHWHEARIKVDDMSLRERTMMFVAAAIVLVSLINNLLLEPLLVKQKALAQQVIEQQAKMKTQQAAIQLLLKAKKEDQKSPLRIRTAQLKQQLQTQEEYLKSRSDRLVQPEYIANLLEQVLSKQGKLQLVNLETLPLALLIEKPPEAVVTVNGVAQKPNEKTPSNTQKEIFKHGVKITVRGSYLDVLHYLTALEKLPSQMFWGEVELKVDTYPNAVVSLTLFTLSLDKIWLTV
jgi:MSHA biogenesis protein MshJ